MRSGIKNFHSQMMQYVAEKLQKPEEIESLKLQAKSLGVSFEDYSKFCSYIHHYNEGIITGSGPLHMLRKSATEFDVKEVLMPSIADQEFRYSKVINAEGAVINKELLALIIKRLASGKKADIRSLQLPKDTMPIDGKNSHTPEEYQQELIISLISIIKEKLKGYESEVINQAYYDNKNIDTRIFNLTKSEMDILFKIDINSLQRYMADEELRKRVPGAIRQVVDFLIDETEYEREHIGSRQIFKNTYGINKEGCLNTSYSHRIYMNTPVGDVGYKFINEFIKKCMAYEIPYDMKAFFNSDNSMDKTILYSNNDNFLKHIEILESIAFEHPDWLQYFGTPVHSTITPNTYSNRNVKNWYGVSLGQGVTWGTANDYFDRLAELAYVHFCYTNMPEIRNRFKSNFNNTSLSGSFDRVIQNFERLEPDPNAPFVRRANDIFSFAMEFYSDKELVSYCGKKMSQIISDPEKEDIVLDTLSGTMGKIHSIYQTGTDKLNANHPAISENMFNLYEKDKANRK